MGLVLASMIVSCSDEDNTIVPETNPDPVIPTEGTFILPAPAVESNIPEHNFLMGALFSFQKNLRNGEDAASGGTSSTTFYNKPLFEVKSFGATETEWWDNLVEEMVYSGLDLQPKNLHEIVEYTHFSVTKTINCLTELELEGLVERIGHNFFVKKTIL